MTIYWERCNLCSRYIVVRNCTLHSDVNICIYCCTSCLERDRCPKPVWLIGLEKPVTQIKKMSLEDKKKLMEDLLSKIRKTS
ncbi:MAG: hypothetical protein QXX35_01650 [Desulfurococcaceae archaeon]|uniref:Uncharacterized protein n=1 Tax=Staphylothermus marinus TaxID=2280 RepID=A0A7C4D7U1_STAMA